LRKASLKPLGERLDLVTHSALGALYIEEAEGEGQAPDLDPPSRYDVFDCMTLVEEALSLSISADPLYAPAIRNVLRYKERPSYASRRHFMEAEWIPNAIQSGYLTDITASLGQAELIQKEVSLNTWKRWGRRTRVFQLLSDPELPTGAWSLPVLSIPEALKVADQIPAGALILSVRTDRSYVPTLVFHVGIAVIRPGDKKHPPQVAMRHASRMGKQTVREDALSWYIQHLTAYTKWPVAGITVLLPREQGPRLSAIAPKAPS
jgi:hypothetical protein